jgi:hypothetical protein
VEAIPLATVTIKPDRRGEHEVTVKTIARGMPGDSGVTVVTMLVCFLLFTHEAAGASSARHSLRPLISEGRTFLAKLGHAPRDREVVDSKPPSLHAPRAWWGGVGGGGSIRRNRCFNVCRGAPHPQPLPAASRGEGSGRSWCYCNGWLFEI